MSSVYVIRRRDQRTAGDADQAEFAAVLRETAVVDAGVYDDKVAGALDDFDPDDSTVHTHWHRQDLQYDTAVGRVHEEIERRQAVMGDSYPFTLDNNQIAYRRGRSRFYEFCLATCCASSITAGEFVDLPRSFERITALIVRSYLGELTEAMHTGWPRDEEVGIKFREAMERLSSQTGGEWRWGPDPDLPEDPTTTQAKDEGVDFVVWKRSPDRRVGQLFLLGQCACGDDWDQKLHDLDLEKLKKWFNPLSYVTPVRVFATPHHLSDGHLIDAQRQAGLVFDRARLAILADRLIENTEYHPWRTRIDALAALVIRNPSA